MSEFIELYCINQGQSFKELWFCSHILNDSEDMRYILNHPEVEVAQTDYCYCPAIVWRLKVEALQNVRQTARRT